MADWQPVSTAPSDRAIQLARRDAQGTRDLHFPCRRTDAGWINAATGSAVSFAATHWREWSTAPQACAAVTEARLRVNRMMIGAELGTLYDAFLRQPIPPDLARLLDQLAQQELQQVAPDPP